MKVGLVVTSLFQALFITAQGTVELGSNSNWVNQGSPSIVLVNSSLNVSGAWNSSSETLSIEGNAPSSQTLIGGNVPLNIFDLTINKSSNGIFLNGFVSIKNLLDLQSGGIDLNAMQLELDNATLHNEDETNFIFGTGSMTSSQILNAPSQINPGNLGAMITSASNLGLTTIIRSHSPVNSGSHQSIARQYTVTPANNSSLNATLRFHYLDQNINSHDENTLSIWENNGSGWMDIGSTAADINANWVELSGLNSLNSYTVTDAGNPLPVVLLFFSGEIQDDRIVLEWRTASEINNEKFVVEKGSDGVHFVFLSEVDGQGTSESIADYMMVDRHPTVGNNFYRLRQVDYDGQTEVFNAIAISYRQPIKTLNLFPNPANDHFQVEGMSGNLEVKVFDLNGEIVIQTDRNDISTTSLEAGLYVVQVVGLNETTWGKIMIHR